MRDSYCPPHTGCSSAPQLQGAISQSRDELLDLLMAVPTASPLDRTLDLASDGTVAPVCGWFAVGVSFLQQLERLAVTSWTGTAERGVQQQFPD